MGLELSGALAELDDLTKAGGPFIGPRGGKWADAQHTIPWDDKVHGSKAKQGSLFGEEKKPESKEPKVLEVLHPSGGEAAVAAQPAGEKSSEGGERVTQRSYLKMGDTVRVVTKSKPEGIPVHVKSVSNSQVVVAKGDARYTYRWDGQGFKRQGEYLHLGKEAAKHAVRNATPEEGRAAEASDRAGAASRHADRMDEELKKDPSAENQQAAMFAHRDAEDAHDRAFGHASQAKQSQAAVRHQKLRDQHAAKLKGLVAEQDARDKAAVTEVSPSRIPGKFQLHVLGKHAHSYMGEEEAKELKSAVEKVHQKHQKTTVVEHRKLEEEAKDRAFKLADKLNSSGKTGMDVEADSEFRSHLMESKAHHHLANAKAHAFNEARGLAGHADDRVHQLDNVADIAPRPEHEKLADAQKAAGEAHKRAAEEAKKQGLADSEQYHREWHARYKTMEAKRREIAKEAPATEKEGTYNHHAAEASRLSDVVSRAIDAGASAAEIAHQAAQAQYHHEQAAKIAPNQRAKDSHEQYARHYKGQVKHYNPEGVIKSLPALSSLAELTKSKPIPLPTSGKAASISAMRTAQGVDSQGNAKKSEEIPGGLASGKEPEDFDASALKQGAKVEMEHTKDPKVAREIAMDHLAEDPLYYTKLARMESGKKPAAPKPKSKADRALLKLLKKNPKPEDEQIHALAAKLGVPKDELEERAYALLAESRKEKRMDTPDMKKSGLDALAELTGSEPIPDLKKSFYESKDVLEWVNRYWGEAKWTARAAELARKLLASRQKQKPNEKAAPVTASSEMTEEDKIIREMHALEIEFLESEQKKAGKRAKVEAAEKGMQPEDYRLTPGVDCARQPRLAVAHAQAVVDSRARALADQVVTVGRPGPAPTVALQKGGDGQVVRLGLSPILEGGQADQQAARLAESRLGVTMVDSPPSMRAQGMIVVDCPACGGQLLKAITVCPHCGDDRLAHRPVPAAQPAVTIVPVRSEVEDELGRLHGAPEEIVVFGLQQDE